ncbi:MAG TPA: hypothetical protein VK465_01530 [Fibrobacteria bacterium]|nr:hypothetical protein [Fibrobacteria bacterium]
MPGLASAKRALKGGLAALGLDVRRIRPGGAAAGGFSNFGEEAVIQNLLARSRIRHRFCVDIGAGDGEQSSNTCFLYRQGWAGLSVEWDGGRFARMAWRYAGFRDARLLRARVTPGNVNDLLAGAETPREFGFLSLDIDSYDHFVLDRLLGAYRPAVICAEINEKVPPPVRFTVRWDPTHAWAFDHFYGQSLSSLEDLGLRHGYVLVGLEYNNAFLVPADSGIPGLSAEAAYRRGYLDRPDRLARLPWNRDMEPLHSMVPEAMVEFLKEKFKGYEGKYVLSSDRLP